MRKSNKKGFTVVELVIVIAIIAILAAVLIPTFAGLIQKANESKDTQLVKNLNTALAADNKEHKTMTDALDAAAAFGYDVGKINASATGNEILWDSKNDVFCYLKGGNVEYIPETNLKNGAVAANETYMLWKIYTEAPATQTYSIYWNSDADFTAPLTVGFDAGNNTAITALKYERPTGATQTVTIRTNGGELTINAQNDNVTHYGDVNNVNVIAVKSASYHEVGTVIGTISVQSGHVQVEAGATVASIVAEKKAEGNTATATATVTAANGATVGTVVVNDATAEVKVESGATVATVAPGKDVTLDSSKVTGTTPSATPIDTTQASNFAGGLGTEASPYLIANATHFQNIVSGESSAKKYYKIINDIEFTEDDEQVGAKNGWDSYHGQKVSYIVLDGQGHTIKVGSDATLFDYLYKSTISNLTVTDVQYSLIGYAQDITINKVDTYGNITWSGGNQGIYMIYAYSDITINDCDNYATINSGGDATDYNAVYVGYAYPGFWGRDLTFTDCDNYGSLTSGKASMFVANLAGGITYFNISNCNNYGTIRATYLGYTPNCFCSASESNAKSIQVNGTVVDLYTSFSTGFYHGPNDTIVLTKNEDNTLTFTKSSNTSVAYYKVSVGLYVDVVDSEGNKIGTNRVYATERIDANDADSYTSTLKVLSFVDNTWVKNNATATIGSLANNTTYTLNGTTYYLVTGEGNTLYGNIRASGMVSVSAYDANGNLISSASYSY